MSRSISKKMNKNLSNKHCQKRLYHTKQSVTDAVKATTTADATLVFD